MSDVRKLWNREMSGITSIFQFIHLALSIEFFNFAGAWYTDLNIQNKIKKMLFFVWLFITIFVLISRRHLFEWSLANDLLVVWGYLAISSIFITFLFQSWWVQLVPNVGWCDQVRFILGRTSHLRPVEFWERVVPLHWCIWRTHGRFMSRTKSLQNTCKWLACWQAPFNRRGRSHP